VTEGSFTQQKNRIRGLIAENEKRIAQARDQIAYYEHELVELMGAAQQEPWWGEAND
jgi:hypothetical protein